MNNNAAVYREVMNARDLHVVDVLTLRHNLNAFYAYKRGISFVCNICFS